MQEPLCTAIEPTTKAAMCQREKNHPLAHKAVVYDGTGTTTVEWYDASRIREYIRSLGGRA